MINTGLFLVCILISGQIFTCQAKEMVAISKSISTKIKEKQGDITDDEVGVFVCTRVCILLCTKTVTHPNHAQRIGLPLPLGHI